MAQSPADVARQERERRKAAKSTTVISGIGTPAAPAVPAQAAAAAQAPPAPAAAPAEKPVERNEQYWRSAFKQAREDATRAEARVGVLDLRVKQLNSEYLLNGAMYNKEYRLGPDITKAQKELEDARKDAELAKKKISDLEEALRRSGSPPGWAR